MKISNALNEYNSVTFLIPTIDDTFENLTETEKVQKLDYDTNYLSKKKSYDKLKNILNDDTIADIPDTLSMKYFKYHENNELYKNEKICRQYADLVSGKSYDGKDDASLNFDSVNDSDDIIKLQNRIYNEINDKFIRNESFQTSNAKANNLYSKVSDEAKTLMDQQDVNLLAMNRLLDYKNDKFYTALFILFLAILIDGTTAIMPRMMEKNRNSILYAKNRKDLVYEEEEIFEELLITNSNVVFKGKIEDKDIESIAEKFKNDVQSFVSILKPIPILEDLGFTMFITKNDFENLQKGNLLQFCQFIQACSYVQFTKKEVVASLKKERGDNSSADQDIYLVKLKFIIWMKQNIKYLDEAKGGI